METAYVTSKGRLVIPARIRRKLGIKPGTKICFVEREHEVLFQPLTKEHSQLCRHVEELDVGDRRATEGTEV